MDEKNIRFMGDQIDKVSALAFVDEVMKEKGQLDGYIEFKDGLYGLMADYVVTVIDDDDSFEIKLESSDKKKNDIVFTIFKETRTVFKSADELVSPDSDEENMDFLDD